MNANPDAPSILVDAHVHFHECYAPARFLDAAAANIAAAARTLGVGGPVAGVLAFAETAGANAFRRFLDGTAGDASPWRVDRTEEEISAVAMRPGRPPLTLVAGRQIVTAERLEVIGLGLATHPPEGAPLADTAARVRQAGGLPVLPWGFGKWWLGRKNVVSSYLREAEPGVVWLGDNGGRWRGAPEPALFNLAGRRGIAVLPGSDPLPFRNEVERVGSYGLVLAGALDPCRPARQVLALIGGLRSSPLRFGWRVGLARFAANQTRMQWRKARRHAA